MNRIFCLALAILSMMGFSSDVSGQRRGSDSRVAQNYVISAKAGSVAYAEGEVRKISDEATSVEITRNQRLEAGEFISTGNGRAEVLLNPGSFLRVGPNSQMRFTSTSLDDISVELKSGTFIFELFADDDFSVLTKLGNSVVRLTRTGVFRVDVRTDGSSSLAVVKGRAVIGVGISELRSGRRALFEGDEVRVEKFNRNARDHFDTWSQNRAKEVARNTARLQTGALRESMLSSFDMGAWNFHRTLGVWVYDDRSGLWSFLPFGMGWSSPYGYGLGMDLWFLNLPYYVYRPGPQTANRPGTSAPAPNPNPNPNPNPGNQPRTGGDTEGDGQPEPDNPPRRTQPVRPGPDIPAFRRFEINQRISGNDSTTPPIRVNRDSGEWMPGNRRQVGPSIDSSTVMPGGGSPSQGPIGPVIQSQPGIERQPSGGRMGGGENLPVVRDN